MLLMQNFSVCGYGFGTTCTPNLAVRVKPAVAEFKAEAARLQEELVRLKG